MDVTVPEWLTSDFLEKCLHDDVRYKDVVIKSFSAASAVPPGNNYGSVLFRVMINYERKHKNHNVSLIVKCPITEGAKKEIIDTMVNTEPFFYNEFIPEVYKKINCSFAPKTFNSPINSVVVMEDLKAQGYLMADRIKQLDFEHCLLYANAASSFHAVSSILKKEQPELITSICSPNVYTNESDIGKLFKNLGLWGVECMAKHVTDKKIKTLLTDSLKKLWDMLIELHMPNKTFNCVVQGDPWTTNMMFKYDGSGNVTDIKLIDFQMVTMSSPIHDLVTFIWTSADRDVREHKLHSLYSHYHNRLNENLKVFNGAQIDFDDFMDNVKRFSPLALVTAAMIPAALNPNPMDLDGIATASLNRENLSCGNPMEQYYTESYCSTDLPLLVRHLEAAGVFDYLRNN